MATRRGAVPPRGCGGSRAAPSPRLAPLPAEGCSCRGLQPRNRLREPSRSRNPPIPAGGQGLLLGESSSGSECLLAAPVRGPCPPALWVLPSVGLSWWGPSPVFFPQNGSQAGGRGDASPRCQELGMEQGQAQGHSSTGIILGDPSPRHPQALPWLGGLLGGGSPITRGTPASPGSVPPSLGAPGLIHRAAEEAAAPRLRHS